MLSQLSVYHNSRNALTRTLHVLHGPRARVCPLQVQSRPDSLCKPVLGYCYQLIRQQFDGDHAVFALAYGKHVRFVLRVNMVTYLP